MALLKLDSTDVGLTIFEDIFPSLAFRVSYVRGIGRGVGFGGVQFGMLEAVWSGLGEAWEVGWGLRGVGLGSWMGFKRGGFGKLDGV